MTELHPAPEPARAGDELVRRAAADIVASPTIVALLTAEAEWRREGHGDGQGDGDGHGHDGAPLSKADVLDAARLVADLEGGRVLAGALGSGARAIAWRAGEIHIEGALQGPSPTGLPPKRPSPPEPSFLHHLGLELARRMPEVVAPRHDQDWHRHHKATHAHWLRLRAPALTGATAIEVEIGPSALEEYGGRTDVAAADVVDRLMPIRALGPALAALGGAELRRARRLAGETVGLDAAFEVVEAVVPLPAADGQIL